MRASDTSSSYGTYGPGTGISLNSLHMLTVPARNIDEDYDERVTITRIVQFYALQLAEGVEAFRLK